MDQRHRRTNFSKQQCIFNSRVTTADNTNILAREELAIARPGFDDSLSDKLVLAGYSQFSRSYPVAITIAID